MKRIVRYRVFTIPNKLLGEYRLTIDNTRSAPEFSSTFEGGKSTNIALFPVISINIVRQTEIDEIGNKVRAPWNVNDSITLTKFTIPIFVNEVEGLYNDLKMPELYSYHKDRLELNSKLAEKIRRVFMIGNTTIEVTPVVIEKEDSSLVEGIKLKFNNEKSTVALTLNEALSMIYSMKKLDMDMLSLNLYNSYVRPDLVEKDGNRRAPHYHNVEVDIKPKSDVIGDVNVDKMNPMTFKVDDKPDAEETIDNVETK